MLLSEAAEAAVELGALLACGVARCRKKKTPAPIKTASKAAIKR